MMRRKATISTTLPLFLIITHALITLPLIHAFSVPSSNDSPLIFDRFRVACPADASCIKQYDASLAVSNDKEEEVWAAVYRSNNNLPTVLLKDDFLNSMRIATTETTTSSSTSSPFIQNTPLQQETPVAVARLRPSTDFPGKYVLDTMRCWLKKETRDEECDGGSEHTEALSVAIDALLLYYLSTKTTSESTPTTDVPVFEQVIRCKATLVSGNLLEERGFTQVQDIKRDMATHTSSLEDCLAKYADRTLQAPMKSTAQSVALQILAKLGLLDRNAEVQAAKRQDELENKDGDDEEYDPWAGIKQYI
jgi:hypothetical protein